VKDVERRRFRSGIPDDREPGYPSGGWPTSGPGVPRHGARRTGGDAWVDTPPGGSVPVSNPNGTPSRTLTPVRSPADRPSSPRHDPVGLEVHALPDPIATTSQTQPGPWVSIVSLTRRRVVPFENDAYATSHLPVRRSRPEHRSRLASLPPVRVGLRGPARRDRASRRSQSNKRYRQRASTRTRKIRVISSARPPY